MVKIRESLGLCPQHDVLFDTMTVEEHLTFFAKLKGSPFHEVPQEVDHMLKVLHLEDKRLTASKDLSGGMKRKLSVGIALVAGSKFVILDEPTSGMDPEARRQAWDILQSQRAGRTMILSTHFMDEADLLGDRIAIMADGVLQCCGSSLFLKNKYGIGYHLTIVKNPICDVEKISQTIKRHVPDAELESNVGAELSFILPKEKSHLFEALFTDLEENQGVLGIDSFGASVTTLEEVFLKVGEICDTTLQNNLQYGGGENRPCLQNGETLGNDGKYVIDIQNGETKNGHVENGGDTMNNGKLQNGSASYVDLTASHLTQTASSKSLTGLMSVSTAPDDEMFGIAFKKQSGSEWYVQQFYAMLIKHMIHSWRNKIVTIVQLAVPVIFAIIGCIVTLTIAGPTDPPALPLNLSYFKSPLVPYTRTTDDLLSQTFDNSFISAVGQYGKVENETGQNMDDYLLSIASTSMDRYNRYYMVAGTVNGTESSYKNQTTIFGHFNNLALHAIAISLSIVDNAVFQVALPGSGNTIETVNHPLPRSVNTRTSDSASAATEVGFIFSYCVSFGMSFLIGTFVVFVVNERSVKAKHAQFVSGVGITNFWLSAFVWDAISFLIPSVLIIVIIEAFQLRAYSADSNAGIVFFDLMLYGWSILPFVYLQSFLFKVASTGYTWVTVFNIFTGTAAVLTVFILKIPDLGTVLIGNALEWVFYILLPNFCFNKALQDMYINYEYRNACVSIETTLKTDLKTFCTFMANNNRTNPCCPGLSAASHSSTR
jgi:ATP-binding cassette subfamily A (ABC1) protein 3